MILTSSLKFNRDFSEHLSDKILPLNLTHYNDLEKVDLLTCYLIYINKHMHQR